MTFEGSKKFVPIVKHLKGKVAISERQLDTLIDQLCKGAVCFGGNINFSNADWPGDGRIMFNREVLQEELHHWMISWRGYPRKTEVYYLLFPLRMISASNAVDNIMNELVQRAFTHDGLFGWRDTVYSIKPQKQGFDVHMLINRDNCYNLMRFDYRKKQSYQGLRDILARCVDEWSAELQPIPASTGFTMSFREAIAKGIDYRDYCKVDCLPTGVKLIPIAGVWGSQQDLRCLFVDETGKRLMRVAYAQDKYELVEMSRLAKTLTKGTVFELP